MAALDGAGALQIEGTMAGRIDATHRCPYADGAVTTFGYNGAHRVISVLDPAQQSASVRHPMTMVYDRQGRVTSQTDPLEPGHHVCAHR